MDKKIYPRLADFLNRPLEVPYSKGFVKRKTQWGKRLNLPTDEPGTEPTGLIGKVLDESAPPWSPGNFQAARWHKGQSPKDLIFTEMEYNKDFWSTSYDWKFKLIEDIAIFRQDKQSGEMTQSQLKAGSFIYLNLSFAQNKKLEEVMNGEKDKQVIPVKMSVRKDDGKTGSAVIFQLVGAPVQANQQPSTPPKPQPQNQELTEEQKEYVEEKKKEPEKKVLEEYGNPDDLPF